LTLVCKPKTVEELRTGLLAPSTILSELGDKSSGMAVCVPVGGGKSYAADEIIDMIANGDGDTGFDAVVYLAPLHSIIEERRILGEGREDVLYLQPRPEARCGSLAEEWRRYETRSCFLRGKEDLCECCPHNSECPWPRQLSVENIKGKKVVLGAVQHLHSNPSLLERIRHHIPGRLLTLLDETAIADLGQERVISHKHLEQYIEVLKEFRHDNNIVDENIRLCEIMQMASSGDLRSPEAGEYRFPDLPLEVALKVQERLMSDDGSTGRFLAHDLKMFGGSPEHLRDKTEDMIRFIATPALRENFILFTASRSFRYINHRLGTDLKVLGGDSVLKHPDTKIYNLACGLGTVSAYPNNADQILWFFAQMIQSRLAGGDRILCIIKKKLKSSAIKKLDEYLEMLGVEKRCIAVDAVAADSDYTDGIPVIHYGISGVNAFEDYECCLCLSGYYFNGDVLDYAVQEAEPEEFRIDSSVAVDNMGVRHAQVPDRYKYSCMPEVYRSAQMYHEGEVVMQAVGRVRPFTKPRFVMLFNNSRLPRDLDVDLEFLNLKMARDHFGFIHLRAWRYERQMREALDLRASGMSQAEVAVKIGVSERTIQRYENSERKNKI
jgi:hypothetical protein